jgi:hypothetical protein
VAAEPMTHVTDWGRVSAYKKSVLSNPVTRLAAALVTLAVLIAMLVVSTARTLTAFSGPCRHMDDLRAEYSVALPKPMLEARAGGLSAPHGRPQLFQPDAMSEFTRREYESAKRRCEAR